jgi:hypothetical protein
MFIYIFWNLVYVYIKRIYIVGGKRLRVHRTCGLQAGRLRASLVEVNPSVQVAICSTAAASSADPEDVVRLCLVYQICSAKFTVAIS